MASTRAQAPGVILPTVPSVTSVTPTRGTKAPSTRTRVVKVPSAGRTTPKLRAVKIKVARPKMPKDAMRLNVPKAKRVKNFKEFQVGRKPII